jgi:peptidoglycan-N-acetylglucosamine deacetylase
VYCAHMSSIARLVHGAKKGLVCVSAFAVGGTLAQLVPPAGSFASTASAATSPAVSHAPRLHPRERYELEQPLRPTTTENAPFDFSDGRIMTGETRRRMILFTFDDGPDENNTPILLDQLDRYGIKAVFFLTTNRMAERTPWGRRHRELAREIVLRGHTIGNHTMNHPRLGRAAEPKLVEEIDGTARFIEEVTGVYPVLFRPPGGIRSERLDTFVKSRGYTMVLWNIGAGDFQVDTASLVEKTLFRVFERRQRNDGHQGGIVLLHDTYRHTVEAFPRIVERILEENCRLLEAGEELYDFVEDPRYFFTSRDGAEPQAEALPGEIPPAVLASRQARLRDATRARCARQ